MDEKFWDERYRTADLIWTATPNQFLVQETTGITPGTALDLAGGEGRNAVWLAEQGWTVTAADFSKVGLAKAADLAQQRGVSLTLEAQDATSWTPERRFDLVAVFYLQLPEPKRGDAFRNAVAALAPGGTLLLVAHDVENLTHGVGGPQSVEMLYDAGSLESHARNLGLVVERAEQVARTVATADGPRDAIDVLLRARRPE